MSELPSDVLEMIFSQLDTTNRLQCAHVCSKWRHTIIQMPPPPSRKKVDISQLEPGFPSFAGIVSCRKFIDIDLSIPCTLNTKELMCLKLLPYISNITLNSCRKDGVHLCACRSKVMWRHMPQVLGTFEIAASECGNGSVSCLRFINAPHIILSKRTIVPTILSQLQPSLQKLTLVGVNLSPRHIQALQHLRCETLKIIRCNFTHHVIAYYPPTPMSVSELIVDCCVGHAVYNVLMLMHGPSTCTLSGTYCNFVSKCVEQAVGFLSIDYGKLYVNHLSSVSLVNHLRVQGMEGVSNFYYLRNLVKLEISGFISGETLYWLSDACPNLESLTTPFGLYTPYGGTIAGGFPNLKTLRLFCMQLDGISSLPKLETLDFISFSTTTLALLPRVKSIHVHQNPSGDDLRIQMMLNHIDTVHVYLSSLSSQTRRSLADIPADTLHIKMSNLFGVVDLHFFANLVFKCKRLVFHDLRVCCVFPGGPIVDHMEIMEGFWQTCDVSKILSFVSKSLTIHSQTSLLRLVCGDTDKTIYVTGAKFCEVVGCVDNVVVDQGCTVSLIKG